MIHIVLFTLHVKVLHFLSAAFFYLFNIICKEHHKIAFNPHFNAKKKRWLWRYVCEQGLMVYLHYPTPTQTETDTDTDKLTQNPMTRRESVLISFSVQYEHLHAILYNPFFKYLGVMQCEQTITDWT